MKIQNNNQRKIYCFRIIRNAITEYSNYITNNLRNFKKEEHPKFSTLNSLLNEFGKIFLTS